MWWINNAQLTLSWKLAYLSCEKYSFSFTGTCIPFRDRLCIFIKPYAFINVFRISRSLYRLSTYNTCIISTKHDKNYIHCNLRWTNISLKIYPLFLVVYNINPINLGLACAACHCIETDFIITVHSIHANKRNILWPIIARKHAFFVQRQSIHNPFD